MPRMTRTRAIVSSAFPLSEMFLRLRLESRRPLNTVVGENTRQPGPGTHNCPCTSPYCTLSHTARGLKPFSFRLTISLLSSVVFVMTRMYVLKSARVHSNVLHLCSRTNWYPTYIGTAVPCITYLLSRSCIYNFTPLPFVSEHVMSRNRSQTGHWHMRVQYSEGLEQSSPGFRTLISPLLDIIIF
jgi:hypothetical protein